MTNRKNINFFRGYLNISLDYYLELKNRAKVICNWDMVLDTNPAQQRAEN